MCRLARRRFAFFRQTSLGNAAASYFNGGIAEMQRFATVETVFVGDVLNRSLLGS
jgi:hypothetical protein